MEPIIVGALAKSFLQILGCSRKLYL